MPNSMTGYSEASVKKKTFQINVSLKSLNHRFFEVSSYKAPDILRAFEKDAISLLKKNFSRGRFDIFISVKTTELCKRKFVIDLQSAENFYSTLQALKKTLNLEGDISVSDLTSHIDYFISDAGEKEDEQMLKYAQEALILAIERLKKSRRKEGSHLSADIKMRMKEIGKRLKDISKLASSMPNAYAERLRKRLKKLNMGNEIDNEKISELVAITADKCDISEEISRLKIHLKNFNDIIKSDNECGKKLEFYLQEIHREINTVGSKAIKPEITENVVLIKGELEKVREQVQNIE
ncbi:MAG: YicC family protein [Candidatus Schekmanbacteria bacterium]|nr:MAG: YicC family protein [Candidatus Schekmanbacteria bacterium]